MPKRFLPIDSNTAAAVAAVLDPVLIDVLELKIQAKSAHWNLRDANFIAVHRLLDEVAGSVEEAGDTIAERIRQLGQAVNAPSARVSSENTLPKFPTGELSAEAAVTAICASISKTIGSIRSGIEATSGKLDEPITADILTSICGEFEKHLWFLASHL